MFKNYLKVTLRNIKKHKVYSLINIFGLSLSIAICIIVSLFFLNEISFDHYHKNSDNIYRLINIKDNSSLIDYRLKDKLVKNISGIKDGCILYDVNGSLEINWKKKAIYINNLMSVDKNFFKVFTVKFIRGTADEPFQNLNSTILTASLAKKLFPNENPIGKEIILRHQFHLIVSGVIEDFPNNSSIQAKMIVNADNDNFKFYFYCENSKDKNSYRYYFNIYLKLKNNANPDFIINSINKNSDLLAPYESAITLLPLKDMYLHDTSDGATSLKGNLKLLNVFVLIAIIILILSVINYINLTVAQQNNRYKEIGIRKTIGANRKDLIYYYLTESLVLTTIAAGFSFLLVKLGLPLFNFILNRSLSINTLFYFPNIIFLILSVIIIGLIAGFLPAFILSSLNPLRMLNGGLFAKQKKNTFRNVLTVFQFTVSVVIIICVFVIQKQIHFLKHTDSGFNKEQLLRIDLPSFSKSDSYRASTFFNKLTHFPQIKNLTKSNGVPGTINLRMGPGIKGKNKMFAIINADTSFLKTFQIKLIKGRKLLPSDIGDACYINESAYKYLGWNNLNNKKYNNGKKGGYKVIGVVKNFQYANLHNSIEPLCIIFRKSFPYKEISLRIASVNIGQTLDFVKESWKSILPDYPLKYEFYDEWFDHLYRSEEKLASTINIFGFLAICISCLGILGLSIFSSESRKKEIGIRKVHGADRKNLMLMLNFNYVKLVIISVIIATPIGIAIMSKWLQNFAYRTELNWWIFVLSAIIVITIALFTVSFQTWRAVSANPIEALRTE